MKHRPFAQIILLSVVISLLVDILFGGYLAALVSTLPIVRKFGIVQPQAPIVINRRENVRVSDSNDIHDTAESVKSKLSTIISVTDEQTSMVAAAINLTSDGLFLTGKSAVAGDIKQYRIVLFDGRSAPLQAVFTDPASSVVVVKADINGVSVADIASSKDAASGQRIIFVYNTLSGVAPTVDPNFVTFPQRQNLNQVFNSDRPSRVFGVQPVASLVPGEAIVALNGAILAMWDGSTLVSSDVMKSAFQQVLARAETVIRPSFGFSYKVLGKTEAELNALSRGVQVMEIVPAGPAQLAALKAGDIITKFGDDNIDTNTVFEQLLEKYKPGDRVNLSVIRGGQTVQLTLVVVVLK